MFFKDQGHIQFW